MACRIIRPAEPQDYVAILGLARLVADAGESFPWEGDVSREELALYWLPDPQHRVETYVCEAEGFEGVAGVYVMHPAAGGRGAHVAHGGWMVAPAVRGRGLAKVLCAHSLREAKERGYVGMRFNMVVATNVAAVRACTACGFKIMCTLPRVFRHPQRGLVDAHVMFCSFEDAEPAPPPEAAGRPSVASAELEYPAAAACAAGERAHLEPRLSGLGRGGARFSVEPALPEGLELDTATGVISGQPVAACPEVKYRVTARLEAEVTLHVEDRSPGSDASVCLSINEDFATRLATITDAADLMPEPVRTRSYGDWMIWMVHRAWLDDPTLTDLNFCNMHMPPAHVEARIAPKLMAAMVTNTHIEVLSLSNSNVQKAQGLELAAALRQNNTLRAVNLECNWLDSTSVRELALAIKANAGCRIEQLRFSHQKQMGQFFGRPTEEAVGQMMERNETVVKLGFECDDAHWRNLIDRALLRNNDYWRRRQQGPASEEELPTAEERTLGNLLLSHPPAAAPPRLLAEGGTWHAVFRDYIVLNHKLPTTSQLQSCAKNSGTPLPYTVAAPLIRECRSALLDAAAGREAVVTDAFGTDVAGVLRGWAESNDHWSVDFLAGGKRYAFRSHREPAFSVSDAWTEWLQEGRAAYAGKVGGS